MVQLYCCFLIDWCLTPTLAVFQLYRGMLLLFNSMLCMCVFFKTYVTHTINRLIVYTILSL